MVLGNIDLKKFNSLVQNNSTSQVCSNDKETVLIWIDPDKEPTKHIFNDLPNLKKELDSWGGRFIFLTDSRVKSNSFNTSDYKDIPSNSAFTVDNDMSLFDKNIKPLFTSQPEFPVVIVADKDGKIFFISAGYNIGIGEQILKSVK
jgi:hypothetical protein